ncbi:hypothetical protein C1645_734242 [Glomus cerebriforme]|uniref:Uncharacterized protein n=1 Tax=Glomus cerebriforme TaxID=658196 RepID=A0A397TFF4_9GLOM|nr:hypothetical protein C1645_734242 [Glomus cerebriforme]
MSSKKNYEQKTHITPYVQKINLCNNKRIRKKPPKLCPDCKETNDYVKSLSLRVNKIEEIVGMSENNSNKQQQSAPSGLVVFPLAQQISGFEQVSRANWQYWPYRNYGPDPMEVDNPSEYAFYCSSEYDAMELD